MRYYNNSEGQYLFDRNLNFFLLIIRFLIKSFIYLPFLVGGYWAASLWLTKKDPALVWLGLIGIFSLIFLAMIYGFKRYSKLLREKIFWLWLILFLICIIIICCFPAWLIYQPVYSIIIHYVHDAAKAHSITLLITFSIAFYLYRHHIGIRIYNS